MKRAIRVKPEPTGPRPRRPLPERRRPLSAGEWEWDAALEEKALQRMR